MPFHKRQDVLFCGDPTKFTAYCKGEERTIGVRCSLINSVASGTPTKSFSVLSCPYYIVAHCEQGTLFKIWVLKLCSLQHLILFKILKFRFPPVLDRSCLHARILGRKTLLLAPVRCFCLKGASHFAQVYNWQTRRAGLLTVDATNNEVGYRYRHPKRVHCAQKNFKVLLHLKPFRLKSVVMDKQPHIINYQVHHVRKTLSTVRNRPFVSLSYLFRALKSVLRAWRQCFHPPKLRLWAFLGNEKKHKCGLPYKVRKELSNGGREAEDFFLWNVIPNYS